MGQRATTSKTAEEDRLLADLWRLKFIRSNSGQESAPFSVLVIGEARSGKSTLVNNLFKHEVNEARSRQSSTPVALDPVCPVELCEIDDSFTRDPLRGINGRQFHSGRENRPTGRSFELEMDGHPTGRMSQEFNSFRFVERDILRSSYIQSVELLLQKKRVDLIILCLTMPTERSVCPWDSPHSIFAAFGRIVMKAKRTIVALTYADCCSVSIGAAYGPAVQGDHFNEKLLDWKRTLYQSSSVSRKVAKKMQVYPTTDDPSKQLPNKEPWLIPLAQGVREMLSCEVIEYLKKSTAVGKPEDTFPSLDTHTDCQRGVSHSTKSATSTELKATNSRKTATSTDLAESVTGGNESILSQNVYDRPGHLMLLRQHVSRKAAGKGRAALEGLWLDAAMIETCFKDNPQNEESAVQAGIIKWIGGDGRQPPTWGILLEVMRFAEIAQQHVQGLEKDLGLPQAADSQP